MKVRPLNVLILVIIFILFGAAITNPKKEAYVNWIKEEAIETSSNSIEKGVVALLGTPIIQSSTKTHNYIFCTVYETTLGSDKIKVLGIYNNFIPISKKDNTEDNSKLNVNGQGA
jgi:hypothetical protein